MNATLLDFAEHVERTEPKRQQQLKPLAFDETGDSDKLEWTIRDVIEELEFLVDLRATMSPEDFVYEARQQARRLLK